MYINLQIPVNEYGAIATLAAVANLPIDKYVIGSLESGLDAEAALREARKMLATQQQK
jgi:hypothetical protein